MTAITDNGFARVDKNSIIRDFESTGALTANDIAYSATETITEKIDSMGGGGGGGAVDSVNGQTGVVVLDADDIAATTNKNYVTDSEKIVIGNTSGSNSGDVTVSDSSEIDFTLTGQQISGSLKAGSIDEAKLDASVNASLDLADSAVQPAGLTNYFLKTVDDTDDITVGATNKFATAAEKTKLGHITVTQAVDLDTMESDIATKATGASSSTDNAIARFDSTTGKLIQNSSATIDDNGNIYVNNYFGGLTSTVSAGGTTVLTVASTKGQRLTGSSSQTFQLPVATTLPLSSIFEFDNNSSSSLIITNAGATTLYTVPAGGAVCVQCTNNGTSNGVWDFHAMTPASVTWSSGVSGLIMNSALSTTPSIASGASSSTVPAFIPQRGASTTGFGGDGTNIYGIIAGTTRATISASGITATNLSGTNTGDQTSIVGITGTKAQFNTAVTDGDIVFLDSTDTLTNKTLTTPVLNGTPTGTGVATDATASTLALRDANGNLNFNNWVGAYTSTVTSAGTLTLTVSSSNLQRFSGTTTHTVTLPVTTTLAVGHQYEFINDSTGAITINSSGANLVYTLPAGFRVFVTCILNSGTTAASWTIDVIGASTATGTGALVFGTSPTLVTPALGTPSALVATNATGTASGLTAGDSTKVGGITISGTPSTGQVPTATSSTTATWQTPSGGGSKQFRITIPGELVADTAGYQGFFWYNDTGASITVSNVAVAVAKAGTTCSVNVYKSSGTASDGLDTSAVNLFTSAIALGSGYTSATNVPNTTTVESGRWVTGRVTSVAGAPANMQIIVTYS